jgi:hypothetical protein
MSANDGGPAFPVTSYVNVDGETHESSPQGMTLRDYFAAKAMQGTVASEEGAKMSFNEIASWSYGMADAMLKARES